MLSGLSYSTKSFGARGVGDRRLQALAERQQHLVRAFAAVAGIDRDPAALGEQRSQLGQFIIVRTHHRRGTVHGEGRPFFLDLRLRDVARQDDDGHAAARQRRLRGQRRDALRLVGRIHLRAEDAAACVDRLEVHLLRKVHAELARHDLARDQHQRRAVAVGFVDAVDEMQPARPARAGAGRQLARQVRLRAGGESGRLFVPHMHPLDLAAADRVGDVVQRVPDDAVAAFDAGLLQGFDDEVGDFAVGHGVLPLLQSAKATEPSSRARGCASEASVGFRRTADGNGS